jgi:hypothetical protein
MNQQQLDRNSDFLFYKEQNFDTINEVRKKYFWQNGWTAAVLEFDDPMDVVKAFAMIDNWCKFGKDLEMNNEGFYIKEKNSEAHRVLMQSIKPQALEDFNIWKNKQLKREFNRQRKEKERLTEQSSSYSPLQEPHFPPQQKRPYETPIIEPEEKPEENEPQSNPHYSLDFEKWYSEYPAKKNSANKEKAWQEWQSVIRSGVKAEEILKALQAWKASKEWAVEDGRYIDVPQNWLSKAKYNSAPSIPQPKPDKHASYPDAREVDF